jgi:hypothetical protein
MSALDHVWGANQRGGPAYPSEIVAGRGPMGEAVKQHHPGMSLRQYYAAHAPAVPDWFKYNHDERPPSPHLSELTFDQAVQFKMWMSLRPPKEPLDPAVKDFIERKKSSKEELDEWRDRMREAKFFAWRWHYADMMMKTGGE